MGDDERDIRALLETEAERAPRPKGLRRATVRRGIGGRIGFIALPVLLVASVAWIAVASPFDGTTTPEVVGPAPSPGEGLIAFSIQDNNDPMPWIATAPLSGGEATRLREGSDPSWSPDGTRIAYRCYPGICTMKTDGSDVVRLTNPEEGTIDEAPDWGAGDFIAFSRYYMDGETGPDIFIVRAEDGKPTPLVEEGSNLSPSWSPDGRKLAFIRGFGGSLEVPRSGFQLWTVASDRTDLRQLTERGATDPDWSPDGSSILFDHASTLWTIPAEGGEPEKLPVVSGDAFDVGSSPSWAPDGRRFVFTCSSKGKDDNDICLSQVGADQWTALVATGENEASPAWQPTVPAEDFDDGATFGRYVFSTRGAWGADSDPGDNVGVVEVSSDQRSVCLNSNMPGATSAHLRREGAESWDYIVIFEIPREYRTSICTRGLDGPSLQAVIDDPTAYLIEFSNKFTGETLSARLAIMGEESADDADRKDGATEEQGTVSCKDSADDLMSEGSGDQSGPAAEAPEEPQPGTDLSGFSMARNPDGTLEMNWGTHGRIPNSLEDGAKLSFVLTGTSKEPGYTFASITATLSNDRWKLFVRNEDDEAQTIQQPEVAGNVVNVVIETVPRLMRGTFKWRAFSEWIPEPTNNASEIYSDYCPDSGSPRFEGTSS